MVPNYQAMNGETLFFYATPYHHWACPSNVTDVATTFYQPRFEMQIWWSNHITT
jgi:hypothetical protein